MSYDNSVNPAVSGSYIAPTQPYQAEIQENASIFDDYTKGENADYSEQYEYKPPLFIKGLETYSYYCNSETLPFLVISPVSINPDNETPMIVYLHGDYQKEGDEWLMYENQTPGGIMTEEAGWDLANFNGIIICPQTTEGWDNKDGSDDKECWQELRSLVGDLKNQLNIGKTVLIGGSSGAKGVLDIINKDWSKDFFDFAVVISAFGGKIDNAQIESIGVTGEYDKSYDFMKRTYGDNLIVVEADHDSVVYEAFRRDEDDERFSIEKDGNPDIIEIAFKGIM